MTFLVKAKNVFGPIPNVRDRSVWSAVEDPAPVQAHVQGSCPDGDLLQNGDDKESIL